MLAGVSLTWYTWLEQGRRINASPDVLSAIGRALKLDEAGIDHLLGLAQQSPTPLDAPQEAPSALVRLIESMEPAPAYVLGPRWEFLAWNAAQARLYPRINELEGLERNLLWVLFADPFTKELIVDWDIHSRQALAEFRAGTATLRGDGELAELVAATVGYEGQITYDTSKPDGTPVKGTDISLIKSLGWLPKIKLTDGIRPTYENFLHETQANALREA